MNSYSTTAQLNTLLSSKQDTITTNLPLSKVGNNISTLWKPSSIFSSDSFFTFNDNDATGSLSIVANPNNLTFDDVSIRSPSGTVRTISGDNNGKILYNNSNLASESFVNSQITANALQANLPLQINSGIIQTLFKPSVITAPNTITLTANDLTGDLNIEPVPDNLEFTTVKVNQFKCS